MTMQEVEYQIDILDYTIYLSDSDITELDEENNQEDYDNEY